MNAHGSVAIILAAGVGKRLTGWNLPKCLLPFSGRTLLARHLQALRDAGIDDIYIVGGHRIEALADELQRLGDAAALVFHKREPRGSLQSLQVAAPQLRAGRPVVLMDADVLFAPAIFQALLASPHANTLLVDMHPVDDESVKLCFMNKVIVDFHKRPERPFDRCGESVGFFYFSPAMAAALADRCDSYTAPGMPGREYEAALRDVILAQPAMFGAQQITGLPWIEIDFDADIVRAQRDILPQLEAQP